MLKEFLDNSYLFGGNAPFIEELYEKYLANPDSVPDEWRDYFDRHAGAAAARSDKDVAHAPVVESFVQRAKAGELAAARTLPSSSSRRSGCRSRRCCWSPRTASPARAGRRSIRSSACRGRTSRSSSRRTTT